MTKNTDNDAGEAPVANSGFPVVGIGASAGGLESLERFFDALDPDPGMAYVVLQHLSPNHRSLMDQLLQRHTPLPVVLAETGMLVERNAIYLLPPGKVMTMDGMRLVLRDKEDGKTTPTRPIDLFFQSLAKSRGEACGGVVLSGTGTDGTEGSRAIREHGGVVLAESHSTARFYGMPKSVIDHELSDGVMTPEEMPSALMRVFSGGTIQSATEAELDGFDKVLGMIRLRYDIDFSTYKPATLVRRIVRRAQLQGLDPEAYLELAAQQDDQLEALRDDLLINVTRLFRDPASFEKLSVQVLEQFTNLPSDATYRVWVPGCATGEEAYTLAIIAVEAAERAGRARRIKVFATDLNRRAVEQAGRRLFREEELRNVSLERLSRFFERQGQGYRISKSIRELIIFSPHDVVRDAPFNGLHLISCRNLLIYLKRETQTRVLTLFHFSLSERGILFLGGSETVDSVPGGYEAIDEEARLFRKVPFDLPRDVTPRLRPRQPVRAEALSRERNHNEPSLDRDLYDHLCQRYLPPTIVLDSSKRVMQTYGGAERFLSLKPGRVDTDIFSLLDAPQKATLAASFRVVDREKEPAEIENIFRKDDDAVTLRIERVDSAVAPSHRYALIFMTDAPAVEPSPAIRMESADTVDEEVQSLYRELTRVRHHLRTAVEDVETSNEQLQTTNEELIASNEELQSTNEELSSVNEELYTVNSEYQSTIQQLKAANEDIQRFLSSTEIATLFLDADLCVRRFTPPVREVIDLENNDVGRKVTSFRHHLNVDLEALLREAARRAKTVEREVDDDRGRRLLLRVFPVSDGKDGDNAPVGITVTLTDITTAYRAAERLKDRERRLQRLTNALPLLIAYVDRDLRFRFINDKYVDVWGLERDQILGSPLKELWGDDAFAETKPYANDALQGEHVEFEVTLVPMGEARRWLISFVPFRDGDGDVQGFYSTGLDITHRHQTALALEGARAAEAQASEAKSQFLANVSHEVRTPLTAILGFADLLEGEIEGERAERFLATIHRNGRHLLSIVNDLLDLSNIEAGQVRARSVRYFLVDVIWEVYDSFQIHAADTGVEFHLELPESLPAPNVGDPLRLRQILFNLLTNAFKFTPEGVVRLIVTYETEASEVTLAVTDTGVGFPEEAATRIFEAFQQYEGGGTRRYQGSGLGLAISARLARTLGGELRAESTPDEGSSFELTVPLVNARDASPMSTERRRAPAVNAEGRELHGQVLVVDDNDDVRDLVSVYLRDAGAQVVEAASAAEALERASEMSPDLVFMDVQMPEVDGLEATRRLRARGFEAPIVALTARALRKDREECLAAGCDEYFAKPINVTELMRVAQRLLALAPVSQRTEGPTSKNQPSSLPNHVLIVEDDPDNGELLRLGLVAKGFDARLVASVEDALSEVERQTPEAIISDLNLPGGMSGFDLVAKLRERATKPLTIALSGAAEMKDAALEQGFDHFALKPCSLDDVVRLLGT